MPKIYGHITWDYVTHKAGPNGFTSGHTPVRQIHTAVGPRIATTQTRESARRLRQAAKKEAH